MFQHRRLTRDCLFFICFLGFIAATLVLGGPNITFKHEGGAYVVYLTPTPYVDAIATCGSSPLLPSPGTLLHVEHITHLLLELSVTQQELANALVSGIATVTASNPRYQEYFDVWVLDRYRACRGATYIFEDENYFMTTDVPCEWRLCFVCAEESVARAQGYTVSSPWLAQYRAAVAAPSTYRGGPGPGPGGSGLRLVQSDLVLGNPSPPAGLATPIDQSQDFWVRGPVATALFRGDGTNLFSLKVLREDDAATAWPLYRNQSTVTDYIGFNVPDVDGGSKWETWNVPLNASRGLDYVVSVQGCHDPRMMVERLLLVTRTGRQYLLGRADCSATFREDAPPGGYLAGFTGYTLQDATVTNDYSTGVNLVFQTITADVYVHIYQLRMLWAVPAGSPSDGPVFSATTTVPVISGPSCPLSARPVAPNRPEPFLAECGGNSGAICPTNQCCGDRYTAQKRPFSICGMGITPCQVGCLEGSGLCGLTPERPLLLFVRSGLWDVSAAGGGSATVASAAATAATTEAAAGSSAAQPAPTTLYAVNRNEVMTYAAAVRYCSNLSYLGYAWSLVNVRDAIDWATSLDTRRGAYLAISNVFFWTAVNDLYVSMAPEYTCIRATFALPRGPDRTTHMFYPSSCLVTSGVVCKAAAAQNVSRLGLAAVAAANRSALWVPGDHTLLVSRRLAAGPYGASCSFAVGVTPLLAGGNTTTTTTTTIAPAANTTAAPPPPPQQQQTLYQVSVPPSAFQVSMAVVAPRAVTKELVVTGLRVLFSEGASDVAAGADGASAASVSSVVAGVSTQAGVGSSGGWHTLTLAPGEVVVAVSGCAGGFVERLVFHTSAGRLWSTPFGSMSVCSAPFLEQPPPGGYLVGLQGFAGYGVEHLRLVWASPVLAPSPLAPPAAAAAGEGASGLSSGAIAGIVVGSVAGAALLLITGSAVLLLVKRQRQAPLQQLLPHAKATAVHGGEGGAEGAPDADGPAKPSGHGGGGSEAPDGGASRAAQQCGGGRGTGGHAVVVGLAHVALDVRGVSAGDSSSARATTVDTSAGAMSSSNSLPLQLDRSGAAGSTATFPGGLPPVAATGAGAAVTAAGLAGVVASPLPASSTSAASASAPELQRGGTGPGQGSGVRVLMAADAAVLSAATATVTGHSSHSRSHSGELPRGGHGSAGGGCGPSSPRKAVTPETTTAVAGSDQHGGGGGGGGGSSSGARAKRTLQGQGWRQQHVAAAAARGSTNPSSTNTSAGAASGAAATGAGGTTAVLLSATASSVGGLAGLPVAHVSSPTAAAERALLPSASASPPPPLDAHQQLLSSMPCVLPMPPTIHLALTQAASNAGMASCGPVSQGSAGNAPGGVSCGGSAAGASGTTGVGLRGINSLLSTSNADNNMSLMGAHQAAGGGNTTGDVSLRESNHESVRRASERADLVTAVGNLHAVNAGRAMEVVLAPGGPESGGAPGSGSDDSAAALPGPPLVLGQNLVVDFDSLLGRGGTGVVHRGLLRTDRGDMPVAVKMLTTFSSCASPAGHHGAGGGAGGPQSPTVGGANAGNREGHEHQETQQQQEDLPEDDPDVRQHLRMLQQEVAVLRRLDHPNVVRLLGACLDPPRPFLVQELMTVPLSRVIHGRAKDGGPLYPYDLVDVLRIARDIATALMYLHPTVLHRDLKPGNVMLDGSGTAKVLDFGLARFKYATQLPTTNVEVGTTAYMSPESFSNDAKITDRSDIYSWAVIVVELVTRRRPWEGTRNAIIGYLVAIERQRPQLPAEGDPLFPPGLRSLVERCMRHNPEERPSSAEIVKRLTLLLADAAGGGIAAGVGGSGGARIGSSSSGTAAGGQQRQGGGLGSSAGAPAGGMFKLQPRIVSQSRLQVSGTAGGNTSSTELS